MNKRLWLGVAAVSLLIPLEAKAQKTVTLRASREYDATPMWKFFFGPTWRDVWASEITVPVLDLGSYAGGITPFKQGGNQSRTLRFKGADGRTYIFRSVNKDVQRQALPADLRNTPIGEVIQDQTSSMHPTGALAVAVLQEAVGVLQAVPKLVYMPDDARLGEFRETFANTLGQIEERPDEAEEGKSTFANAEKIVGTDKLLENLEESMEDRFESRDYLKARLIDFLVGDTDRGADQWRFAKIEAGDRDVYRPIPRDRDYSFMETGGVLIRIGAMFYPKLVTFGERYPSLRSLTFMTSEFDRTHLADISPEQWDSIARFMQSRLTNDVIARAVAQLPEAHRRLSGEEIERGLRARRDALPDVVRAYFAMVNEDAEIFASDENERAEVDRHQDGTVTVRIWREGAGGELATDGQFAPAFERRYQPQQTQEIRVHLERGNDRAVVRGNVERSIEVRIIGGEGDDVLIDSSNVAKGDKTHFYDAHGDNTIVAGANTRVITKPFVISPPKCSLDEEDCEEDKNPRVLSEERRGRQQDLMNNDQDFIAAKTQPGMRTWGKVSSWSPMVSYREGSGVVLGIGPTITDYGFRRRPYESRIALRGMVGGLSGRVGLQLTADRYFETTPFVLSLFAHATQLEVNRFYGLGNTSEEQPRSETLVQRDEFLVMPAVSYAPDVTTRLSVGPVFRYVNTAKYAQIGARTQLVWDRATRTATQQRGLSLQAGASLYPALLDVKEQITTADALARLYIPLGSATLALRAGGERVWGEQFPLWNAAFLGGSTSLRGYAWNRFAGDASAYGSAELRVPLARITLLTRGSLGVIGFTDAGRVWNDGVSEGDWHTSYGGGLFFGSLGQSVSATYAQGESGRVYLSFGLPF